MKDSFILYTEKPGTGGNAGYGAAGISFDGHHVLCGREKELPDMDGMVKNGIFHYPQEDRRQRGKI